MTPIDDLCELRCVRCGVDHDQHRVGAVVVCEGCLTPAEVSRLYPPRGAR